MKSKDKQYQRVIKYLDSLPRKELGTISKSDIAKKLDLPQGNVGVYLQGYRLANKVDSQNNKRIVFEYLAKLTEEEFKNMSYIKLSKKLNINRNTASAYITKFKRLKTTVKEGYNTLTFPYGPLIALQGAGEIDGRDLRDLSREIGSYFDSASTWYYESKGLSYIERFTQKQTDNIDYLIKNKIGPKIAHLSGYGRKGFYESTLDILRYELKKDLLSLYDMKNLRDKLEKFSSSRDLSLTLNFNSKDPFSDKNEVFSIQITKDDLIDMGFIEWGHSGILKGYGLEQNEKSIDKVVTYLEHIIMAAGNGKVNLVPIVNTGDKDRGYQVLERTRLTDQYKFLPGSGVFKINTISDPNYKSILEHCAKLMLAGDTGFVMKKYNDNINDLESYLAVNTQMIMAFTRERILTPSEIYSKQVNVEIGKHKTYQILITGYSTYFRPTQKNWKDLWVSPHVWTSGGHNTDFTNYFTTIKNDAYWRQVLGAHFWS